MNIMSIVEVIQWGAIHASTQVDVIYNRVQTSRMERREYEKILKS
jgi:hypothetical protein